MTYQNPVEYKFVLELTINEHKNVRNKKLEHKNNTKY